MVVRIPVDVLLRLVVASRRFRIVSRREKRRKGEFCSEQYETNVCVFCAGLPETTTTGVVIKNTLPNKPYKYIEGEERKIEGTQGNTT